MRSFWPLLWIVAVGFSSPAVADHRHDTNIVKAAHRLDAYAVELAREATAFVSEHRDFWRMTVHRRQDAIETLFAVNRLAASVRTFRSLVTDRRIDFTYRSMKPAYTILLHDTRSVGERLERLAIRGRRPRGHGRWAPNPFNRFVARRLLDRFERVADEVEAMGYIREIDELPYVPPTPPLDITELSCPLRKKYTYRMHVCVEGRDLDRSRLRVRFIKRMTPGLDPWEREVGSSELQSSRNLGSGREQRCYYLRQIGKRIRRHQGDNVYAILERPKGRRRVVDPCWEQNVIDLQD